MTPPRPRGVLAGIRRDALARALALGATLLPAIASAQTVLGAGDDALTLRGGMVRVSILGDWQRWYEQYLPAAPGRKSGTIGGLGDFFSFDSIGPAQVPVLGPVQSSIRSLAAMPDFNASLGTSVVHVRDNTLSTPISIEAGLTSRITIGVLVPFVTATSSVDFRINPTGRDATVGFNPTLIAPASAIAADGAFLTQFANAATQLTQQIAFCAANPSSTGCATLNANNASALALIRNSNAFAAGIAQVYGGRGSGGAPFVPIAGTTAELAIEARVAAFKAMYSAFGNSSITGTGPLAAQAPLAIGDIPQLFANPTFGIVAQPLATTSVTGLGDVQFSAKVSLFDSFRRKGRSRLDPHGFNWRETVGAVFVLGSGMLNSPDNFTGLGTGTRNNAVQAQSYTDLLFGPHFWVSVVARYTTQKADERVMRITDSPEQPLVGAYRDELVTRDIGNSYDVQVSPRWSLNDYISLSGHYYYRHKDEDRYGGTFTVTDQLGQPVAINAATLGIGTGAEEHRLGLGIAYSTRTSYERGLAPVAMDLIFQHFQTTLGTGGYVPKLTTDQVTARVYLRLYGR